MRKIQRSSRIGFAKIVCLRTEIGTDNMYLLFSSVSISRVLTYLMSLIKLAQSVFLLSRPILHHVVFILKLSGIKTQEMRAKIEASTQLTASAGIAPNTFLAKVKRFGSVNRSGSRPSKNSGFRIRGLRE